MYAGSSKLGGRLSKENDDGSIDKLLRERLAEDDGLADGHLEGLVL